jgi:Glycosyltransferase family 87
MSPIGARPAPASLSRRWWATRAAALALLLAAVTLLVYFFQQFPIEGTSLAIDWKGLWQGLRANPPVYGNATGLRIAPWDVLLVKPLGWLPFGASWGMLTLLTLAVLVISIPKTYGKKRLWLGSLLLVTSYPAMRHFADGNFEGLIIAGLLLAVYGYQKQNVWPMAAGLLLATAKVQEIWILPPILGLYLLRTWPARRLWALIGLLAVVVIPSLLWLGSDWAIGASSILERGSLVDSSLLATLVRFGWPVWAVAGLWLALAGVAALFAWRSGPTFSREKAAALVAAALLLSPYSAGNSFLTVLAVGILPLVMSGNVWAIMLLVLADLPYLAGHELVYNFSASYWTAMLLLALGMLARHVWQAERRRSAQLVIGPAIT